MQGRLISIALTALLLVASAAVAQPDQKHGHKGDQPAGGPAHGGGQSHGGGQPNAGHPAGGPAHGAGGQGGGQAQMGRGPERGSSPGAQVRSAPPAAVQERGARTNTQSRGAVVTNRQSQPSEITPQASAPRTFNRSAVNTGGRQFVYEGRSHQAIREPAYSYPSGWSYRRWDSGQALPLLFLSSRFFFNDYGRYGLGPPPPHYVWVRYGPDLLLVNRRTGRIRQVIYGAFY
jgi:Ni/Co efflux regulator RcnB